MVAVLRDVVLLPLARKEMPLGRAICKTEDQVESDAVFRRVFIARIGIFPKGGEDFIPLMGRTQIRLGRDYGKEAGESGLEVISGLPLGVCVKVRENYYATLINSNFKTISQRLVSAKISIKVPFQTTI